jgi:hypothetical protein
MTLVTQKASFGVSRDDDPVGNDRTLSVLADSGSNINIIQQKDIKFWGIPETCENKPGRLNDIGTLPTLGVIGLAIPLQGEKMINGIMKPHVHVYTCEGLLINDDTGPKCTLLFTIVLASCDSLHAQIGCVAESLLMSTRTQLQALPNMAHDFALSDVKGPHRRNNHVYRVHAAFVLVQGDESAHEGAGDGEGLGAPVVDAVRAVRGFVQGIEVGGSLHRSGYFQLQPCPFEKHYVVLHKHENIVLRPL